MTPTDDFTLPGRKYAIIRWHDDVEEWWHMRCRKCEANADAIGFFKDIHDLRVHVNATHFECGGLAKRDEWCEVLQVPNQDVRRIKVGGVPKELPIEVSRG